ncbi:signal transduction histidine kinase regulating citrate/malate metabolism [Neobacillus bataviensis LMG 21833]|uniref:Signal transduction histidine kinase regulating citrate/malate metabolism n=2 Tax=Neobacillus bataviensis TaxID=220685 RepID=K6D377_9BACI|nr:signal transduction histidine kinase regulating citrate/malate metabolism [Neobacillus bataviensis LMG 21833]
MESKQIEENTGRLALGISKTVSFTPNVIDAFQTDDPSKTIQPIAKRFGKKLEQSLLLLETKMGQGIRIL